MRIWVLLLVCCFSGCKAWSIPDQAFAQAKDNSTLCDSYVDLMNAGVTTREQDQNFIRANRRAWHSQNFALNNEPLPPDVEAWEAKKKLGLDNTPVPAPAPPSNLTPEQRLLPPERRIIPR